MLKLPIALAVALAAGAVTTSTAAAAHIYWSSGNQVWTANLDGSQKHEISDIPDSAYTSGVASLAVGGGSIYWSGNGVIGRMSMTGGNPRAIVHGAGAGSGGAANFYLRLVGTRLYWDASNGDGNRIISSNTSGGGRRVLPIRPTEGTGLRGFTSANGDLFWLENVDPAKRQQQLSEANIRGGNARPLFTLPMSAAAYGIEVSGAYAYWFNQERRAIYRARLDGTGARVIAQTGRYLPLAVAVGFGRVMWATDGRDVGFITSARPDGSDAHTVATSPGALGRLGVTALTLGP